MKPYWLVVSIALTSFCATAQTQYNVVDPEVIQERLGEFAGNDSQREATLKRLFADVGCQGSNFSEQPIKKLKNPNLICILTGESDRRIIVCAHYDHVERGSGVADNWSSASLLPTLYQSLNDVQRKFTFVFLAFAYEENGMVGSHFYADHLSKDERSKIIAVVNMDTLGLAPTEVWASHADQPLVGVLAAVANQMKLPVTGVNFDGIGNTDSESFAQYKIKRITIHSVTTQNLHILHSPDDNMKAIQLPDYLNTCHLIAAYLASLDYFLFAHPPDTTGAK